MVKIRPSPNPNLLTDYDNTLHNWLCPRDERVTQNLCQSAVRERLAKCVKYKASFLYLFFPGLPTEVTRGWILMHMAQNTRCDARNCLFWVHMMADNILRPRSSRRQRIQDERRHRRLMSLAPLHRSLAVIGRAAYTIYSMLWITAALYFPMIKQNATKVSADALYSVRKFSFGKVYTAIVGNLLYRVSPKMIPCAVLSESLKNLETSYYCTKPQFIL